MRGPPSRRASGCRRSMVADGTAAEPDRTLRLSVAFVAIRGVAAQIQERKRETMILVTGGVGFIGSNFILGWLTRHDEPVVNLDALTYAANPRNLEILAALPGHRFIHGDVCDAALVAQALTEHRPRAVLHFAAESHVDRSISGPAAFVQTNVVGTSTLLDATLGYWQGLPPVQREAFRYVQISTDEVYGSLQPGDAAFHEGSAFAPNSPYAATKAAADHLVRAWHRTYGLPALVTHCSNNYGPHQHPEKLIPLLIRCALAEQALPVYGDGANVRDWLHVADHCAALERVLEAGTPGDTYDIGGLNEVRNVDLVHAVCAELDALRPRRSGQSHAALIRFVSDRRGHDRRYAVDCGYIRRQLGWSPRIRFSGGLRRTVHWYLDNPAWLQAAQSTDYAHWIERQYGGRAVVP